MHGSIAATPCTPSGAAFGPWPAPGVVAPLGASWRCSDVPARCPYRVASTRVRRAPSQNAKSPRRLTAYPGGSSTRNPPCEGAMSLRGLSISVSALDPLTVRSVTPQLFASRSTNRQQLFADPMQTRSAVKPPNLSARSKPLPRPANLSSCWLAKPLHAITKAACSLRADHPVMERTGRRPG